MVIQSVALLNDPTYRCLTLYHATILFTTISKVFIDMTSQISNWDPAKKVFIQLS